jgi:RNA polymerase sigma-70 factor (ECF subfamily)
VRAITAMRAFRGESSARTWLQSIARRCCADQVRRSVRWRGFLASVDPPPSAEPDPAGAVGLNQLVAALAPDRRVAFVLTQVLGLSYEEAAEVCACPVGTIRSRVSRARGDLVTGLQAGHDREALG